MIQLVFNKLETNSTGFRLFWSINGDNKDIFKKYPLEVTYDSEIENIPFIPINFFIGFFLPVLCFYYKKVSIHIPYKLEASMLKYWHNYMESMNKALNLSSQYVLHDEGELIKYFPLNKNKINKIGLLYGGGVESSFALSQIYHLQPILISITGKNWMNNDHSKHNVKKDLEDKMIEECNLCFKRINTNSRYIVDLDDASVNLLHTGLLFYFMALPLCKKYNINTIYKTTELESVSNLSNYDYSLKSTNLNNITIKEMGLPLFQSVYNSFSKVVMFKQLSKTQFIKYVFSCIRLGDLRWCGKCNKCFRISTYCEFTGVPKSLIGMQEGIVGIKETKPSTQIYYKILDKLYGKNRYYYIKMKFQFYRNKGVRGGINYMVKKYLSFNK